MASGYPSDPPPAYDDHDDFDDIDNSVFETEEHPEEPASRRYKKKEDKKKGGARERTASASSVRVQLNRLSEREVDDAKMATVFGKEAQEAQDRNSMKVNPLYDKNGSVEVSSTEAQRAARGSSSSAGTQEQNVTLPKYANKPYKKSKKRTDSHEEDDSNTGPEPKIAYSKNFRFKGPAKQNGQVNGQAGPKKLTTGKIMPSRISRNAIPGSQIMASLSGKERPKPRPEEREIQPQSHPDDLEAAERRSEIRKKWRLVIALILIILIFALILVIVLYFATKGS